MASLIKASKGGDVKALKKLFKPMAKADREQYINAPDKSGSTL